MWVLYIYHLQYTTTMKALFNALMILWISFIFNSCHKEENVSLGYQGRLRTYYIAVDEVEWDYSPSFPVNVLKGEPYDAHENVFVENGPDRIGHIYKKALYREYTDNSFTTLKPRSPEWEHLGALGPIIRAAVGDTLQIIFKNNASLPYTIHPHGVLYNKDSEGASYDDGTSGNDKADDGVLPGQTHTHTWFVNETAGPGPSDPSSIVWLYHSHVNEPVDTYAGLIGTIIITAAEFADEEAKPTDVDTELVTLFHVYNENESHYIDENIQTYATDPGSVIQDDDFEESNLMHAINGYVFGDLKGLDTNMGDRVRWYVVGMGTEIDVHTPHWHGNTGLHLGSRTDILEIFPASMEVFDMVAENPGTWLYHCHVNDHIHAGMTAVYHVH